MLEITNMKIKVQLPFLGIEGDWKPNEIQRKAAWEIYIELITRISLVEINKDDGLLREALSSLYSIFPITREILKKYGPEVAIPNTESDISLGSIAVTLLNQILRPILTKWHPILLDYESKRPQGKSMVEYEKEWKYNNELRIELNNIRVKMMEYSNVLAQAAGVDSLITTTNRFNT